MSEFLIVAGSGHCGTKWLAAVLSMQPSTKAYHELREQLLGKPWHYLDALEPDDAVFSKYWLRVADDLKKYPRVVDSNSWPPHMLPRVNEFFRIDRVVYLTRNPISQLHSLATKSPALASNTLPEAAEKKLRALYELMPNKPKKDFGKWDRFEKLCLLVAANYYMPLYLLERGLNVETYQLERLLTEVGEMKRLAPRMPIGEIRDMQQTDINRKVEGNRDPVEVWFNWEKPQRRAFYDILCADI